MSKTLQEYSLQDVAKHNADGDLWIVVDSKVYDLSKFAKLHPGGETVLFDADIAGKDSTEIFYSLHRKEVLEKPVYQRLIIGSIKGQSAKFLPRQPGALHEVPYSEPSWATPGFHSPYYKESHYRLRDAMSKFCEEVIFPDGLANDEAGKKPSPHVFEKMAELNINAMRLGPGPHLKGLKLMGGLIQPEEFDHFHELILHQCITNPATRGYNDSLAGGMIIGLPAILNYASPALKAQIIPEVTQSKKFIALAISEAFAGSDVAGLRTTATKSADGKYFTVTGTKKWITNGHFSDYFVTACKTAKGLTVLLIPRGPGITTKPIKTGYSSAAGTCYITFDNVKVPAENILGPEDGGLVVILANFNHERWFMTAATTKIERAIVEECMLWANQRKVFGKPLMDQPVVRAKLATMIARVETSQNWLENITYNMNKMSYKEQSKHLAGPIALCKMYTTRSASQTAIDAVGLFGGRGITKTGLGRTIEHFYRTVPFDATLGGAEDVLGDLAVRQAVKGIPKTARL